MLNQVLYYRENTYANYTK
jgi:hypothetical protein